LLSRLIDALYRRRRSPKPSGIADVSVIIVALAVAIWSRPADWSRRPWSDPYRPQLAGSLLPPATYLMLEKPLGYVVPSLPANSRIYQLSDILLPVAPGGSFDRRVRWGLAHPLAGGVWALHLQGGAPRQDLLDAYGLEFDAGRSCEVIPGADRMDIEACPLSPQPQAVVERPLSAESVPATDPNVTRN
jgi:hypothetical protein